MNMQVNIQKASKPLSFFFNIVISREISLVESLFRVFCEAVFSKPGEPNRENGRIQTVRK